MSKIEKILNESFKIEKFETFDVNAEWDAFAKKTFVDKNVENNEDRNLKLISFVIKIAAIFFLMAIFLPLFHTKESTENTILVQDEEKVIELMDGSFVVLSQNSSMTYYTSLSEASERKISLSGQGQFNISHSILPMRLYLEDIFIEVLGTEFTVSTLKSEITEIVLRKGSIKAIDKKYPQNFVILSPGDSVFYRGGRFINSKDTLDLQNNKKQDFLSKNDRESLLNSSGKFGLSKNGDNIVMKKFTLESVIKNYLLKYYRKQVKLDKKAKLDYSSVVIIDNINKEPSLILRDLKNQGLVDYIQGDCENCFIILSPK